ncbi:hypothetical protein C7H09_19270 [Marinobacter fuscus]|uniref:Lipoprotein n=1 Tax=Marinobacter fuscus TaxID=2109942 RepID=A0A2T1K5F3_9GAMM|nr:hypothetical protein [Marinobacter fuscus]PSF04732.1 hypothetical protein C7H09_19270 [Marinobacter fuscus]
MFRYNKRFPMLLAGLLASSVLTGCLETESDDDDSYYGDSSNPQNSSGGACGSYTDLVSASERAEANSCGFQVSSYFASADSALSAAIQSCQQGDSAGASGYYQQHQEYVSLGRRVKSELCEGSSGGGFEDTSSRVYFNLCEKPAGAINGRELYCIGPFQQFETSCGAQNLNYLSTYKSESSCILSGQDLY